MRWLQNLCLQSFKRGESRDDRAESELEFLDVWPALDIEVGKVGQLGEGVRIKSLEVRQVMDHEVLESCEAVETLLGQDADRVEGDVQGGEQGDKPPAMTRKIGHLVVRQLEMSQLTQRFQRHQVQVSKQIVAEVQAEQS